MLVIKLLLVAVLLQGSYAQSTACACNNDNCTCDFKAASNVAVSCVLYWAGGSLNFNLYVNNKELESTGGTDLGFATCYTDDLLGVCVLLIVAKETGGNISISTAVKGVIVTQDFSYAGWSQSSPKTWLPKVRPPALAPSADLCASNCPTGGGCNCNFTESCFCCSPLVNACVNFDFVSTGSEWIIFSYFEYMESLVATGVAFFYETSTKQEYCTQNKFKVPSGEVACMTMAKGTVSDFAGTITLAIGKVAYNMGTFNF